MTSPAALPVIDPLRTALLAMDLQGGILPLVPDPDTQVDARIAPEDGDIVVRKVRIGAASTTDLYERLRERGIDTLILSGISTSGVVLSTLTDAADRDYRVIVLSDGVADRDQEVHRVLLEKVFPMRSYVIDIAELRELLGAA
ncbi:cysteine hydrolase family protein [Streptomyces griseofuscus]|uniref:cysteine hydrolase family protein n=1 Tax=Streptomyces griseofuscus TaxID=146922 RepID=UPI0036808DE0